MSPTDSETNKCGCEAELAQLRKENPVAVDYEEFMAKTFRIAADLLLYDTAEHQRRCGNPLCCPGKI